jgi:hypothetical protein
MKKLIVAGAAALAFMVGASAARAENANLGTISANQTAGHIFAHPKGPFTDTVTFIIDTTGAGSADYFNFLVVRGGSVRSNITDAVLSLTGPNSFSTALVHGNSYPLSLSSGSYTGTITGAADGASGGSYLFEVTAPTPEPETFGMMGVGLAIAAYIAKRRKKSLA